MKGKDQDGSSEFVIDPAAAGDMMASMARLSDRCPNEVAIVLAKVQEEILKRETTWDARRRDDFVGTLFQGLYPVLRANKEVNAALLRMVKVYAVLPSTPTTRLKRGPKDHSIGGAVVVGFALATIVIVGVILYLVLKDVEDSG